MLNKLLVGRATAEGTALYGKRFPDAARDHFRTAFDGLTLSSIGLGTGGYTSSVDKADLERRIETVQRAVETGVNVIDTAISYGQQMAERTVGLALGALVGRGALSRNEIVVASKGGYLPFDAARFEEEFVQTGLCASTDLVDKSHCLAPEFIRRQIDQSRQNLGLSTIDIYFLHNPEEQLCAVGREAFARQIRCTFEILEEAVANARIGCYGFATAEGFRSLGATLHRLDEVVGLAHDVAGEAHHFKVIEVPLNLGMREALFLKNHLVDSISVSLMEAAQAMGITVMTSASVRRGDFPRPLPSVLYETFRGVETEMQVALQFTRSSPGVSVALVGMRRPEHVDENLTLRHVPLVDLTAPMREPQLLGIDER